MGGVRRHSPPLATPRRPAPPPAHLIIVFPPRLGEGGLGRAQLAIQVHAHGVGAVQLLGLGKVAHGRLERVDAAQRHARLRAPDKGLAKRLVQGDALGAVVDGLGVLAEPAGGRVAGGRGGGRAVILCALRARPAAATTTTTTTSTTHFIAAAARLQ